MNESTITPATAVSPQSVEAGSDPVYEMLGQLFNLLFLYPANHCEGHATTLPVELPTPYNNNSLPSPVSPPGVSGTDYVSPITVSTPSTEDEASPVRPPHYRHMSSLSSVPTIANVMRKESRHRQTYRSDTSEGSVELECPRGVELSGSTPQEGRLATTREVDELEGLGIKALP